jgi:hypothetical protein
LRRHADMFDIRSISWADRIHIPIRNFCPFVSVEPTCLPGQSPGARWRWGHIAVTWREAAGIVRVCGYDPGPRFQPAQEARCGPAAILAEDEQLALRISRTNQQARAEIEDLDGRRRVLSIPELLVLRDDAIPKLEQAARAVPLRADDVSVYESGDGWVRYRLVKKVERKREMFSDKGLKVEEVELLGHDVVEVTDYGAPRREQWDVIDRIGEFAQRVKQAINQANKTELAELD